MILCIGLRINGVATQTNWSQSITYDRYGNRLTFASTVGATTITNTPTVEAGTNRFAESQGFGYDKNGNITSDVQDSQARNFIFNGENKQTEIRNPNIAVNTQNPDNNLIGRYFYDGEGKRVKKVTSLETTVFVYSGGKLIQEYSTKTAEHPSTNYTTSDHLGTPRVITDELGAVKSRRDFMPFGEDLYAGIGGRTNDAAQRYATVQDDIRQKFTGYQKDTETNLDFAEARMYDNQRGRFTAVDPLLASGNSANPQTFNRYVYVGNNPVVITDPTGLFGDYYTRSGTYIGTDKHPNDGKVYFGDIGRKKGDTTYVDNAVPTNLSEVRRVRRFYSSSTPGSTSGLIQDFTSGFPEAPFTEAFNGAVTGLKNVPPTLWNGAIDNASLSIGGMAATFAGADFGSLRAGIYGCNSRINCSWSGGTTFAAIAAPGIISGVFSGGASSLSVVGESNEFASPAVQALSNCFVAGTLIHTERGLVATEEIKAGDQVLSYNTETGGLEYQEVARLFRNTADEFLKIRVEGEAETIQVTLGHPFYVHRNRSNLSADANGKSDWVLSKSLRVGDLLKSRTGEWKPILSIEKVVETHTTYNFEVKQNHDYFVGEIGWLVHNQSRTTPSFLGQENGPAIPIPKGSTPTPIINPGGKTTGFGYTGGNGGNGLDKAVNSVRIMNPTLPKGPSPGYPNGYVNYMRGNQAVNPYTGKTISKSDFWWHIPLD